MDTLKSPLLSATFALGGAGLAWLWFAGYWIPAVAIVATVLIAAVGAQERGRRLIRTEPLRALKFLEQRLLAVGIASATAAAVAIVVAVKLTAPEGTAASTSELLGAVSTALVAFFVGLTVSGDDADAKIGEFVKKEFQKQYCGERDPKPGNRCKLPSSEDGYIALYTKHESSWTDWSQDNRRDRIEAFDTYLKAHPQLLKQT